jgi:hypothetical protein
MIAPTRCKTGECRRRMSRVSKRQRRIPRVPLTAGLTRRSLPYPLPAGAARFILPAPLSAFALLEKFKRQMTLLRSPIGINMARRQPPPCLHYFLFSLHYFLKGAGASPHQFLPLPTDHLSLPTDHLSLPTAANHRCASRHPACTISYFLSTLS